MTPDEVRLPDNRYALLFIRGERPVLDEKYDILRHPNIVLTADGKAPPYEHGSAPLAAASVSLIDADTAPEDLPEPDTATAEYELLTGEDFEETSDD